MIKTIVLFSFWLSSVIALSSPAAGSSAAGAPASASVFSVAGLTQNQRITVETLQGLANRKGPRLILSYSGYWSNCAWNKKWIRIYKDEYGLTFKPVDGLMNLLKTHRREYSGLVVFDPDVNGTAFAAMTLAGIEGLLPVDDPAPYVDELGVEVTHDLRGRFKDSVAAYDWALKELMPRCNRKCAHASAGPDVDGKYIGWAFRGYDYCVMQKGFLFNLTFSGQDKKSFNNRTIEGDQAQSRVYRRVLRALDKPAYVLGYGEPEIEWFALMGKYGHQYLHWGDNLSFHAAVKPKRPKLAQPYHCTPDNTRLEKDKYYVCFMMSEGDSMKGPVTFFFDSWSEKDRGVVPITWTLPMTMSKFPAMLEYFYTNATANDYFAGLQIYNYAMPRLEDYARLTKKLAEAADYRCLNGAFNVPSGNLMANKESFFDISKPLGVYDIVYEKCPKYGYQTFIGAKKDIPQVGTAFIMGYWHRLLGGWDVKWQEMLKDPRQYPEIVTALSNEIVKIADNHKPPFVIIVYGDLHAYDEHSRFYRDVADELAPVRFKVTRLDEAFSAMRLWNEKQE